MSFEIGQEFHKSYPKELSEWCRENGAVLAEVATDHYVIHKRPYWPKKTDEERREDRLLELKQILNNTDWAALREYDRKLKNPDYEMDMSIFEYREFLRQLNHGEGQWWAQEIPDYDSYCKTLGKVE